MFEEYSTYLDFLLFVMQYTVICDKHNAHLVNKSKENKIKSMIFKIIFI